MTTVANRNAAGHIPRDQQVYIGRPSKWGNPVRMRDRSGDERMRAVQMFRRLWYSASCAQLRADALVELKDKVLVCYCTPLSCHGDVIAEFVNSGGTLAS